MHSQEPPRFSSALSTLADPREAVAEVCDTACAQLRVNPDLAVLFVSHDRAPLCGEIAADVCAAVGTGNLIGCSGESIVGTGREIEAAPAIALWLASLPGASITPMQLSFSRATEGGTIAGWPDAVMGDWPAGAALLVLADPFSFPADVMLERLNEDRPGVPVVGGMSSGGHAPGENRLVFGSSATTAGAVAALVHGAVRIQTVVSQGCRPIGNSFVVTQAERNIIYELGGRPAFLQLKQVFDSLANHEQALVQRGLHLGRVVNEYQDHFEQGDFLVRNVLGIDQESGAIAIGDYVRPGQTVQFHVRDQKTADDEMRQLLARAAQDRQVIPGGGLLFTCNGRGTRLFDQPHHDAGLVRQVFGDFPLAGFFAQGELGPIGGKNFMHGFTASLALFFARQ